MGVIITGLTKGTGLIPVDFYLTDPNGTTVDLTNTSCSFKMAPTGSLIDTVNGNMTLQSAAGGLVRYTFVTVDLANSGTFNGEIDASYYSGNASGRLAKADGIVVVIGDSEP